MKYKNLVDVENGYHPEGTGDEIAAYHRVYWITHNDAVVEFAEAFRKYESEAKRSVSEERFQEATESMLIAWFYRYGAAFRAISRAMPSLATGMEGIEEMRAYSKAKAFPLTSYARFRLVEMAAHD